jgi:hypothetical protein
VSQSQPFDPVETLQQRETLYGLSGVYLDAYNAIVRPQRKLSIDFYLLRRWAPRLKGTGFWLLITLQQQTYKCGDGQCIVSRDVLAREAAIGEGTVHRYLHDDEYKTSGLCYWVRPRISRERKWSSKVGKYVQPTGQYDVLLDAPLAEVDQRGLAQYLVENGAKAGCSATDIAPALENLMAIESLSGVLDVLTEHEARFKPPKAWKNKFLPTVADVASALGIKLRDGSGTSLMDLCSQTQRHIVSPDWLGTHYFYDKWLPVLGVTPALVVTQLRSLCYWTPNEKRDIVKISMTDLASTVGCTAKRLEQIFSDRDSKVDAFIEVVVRGTKHKPFVFMVKLPEPIAEVDQPLYEGLLNSMVKPDTDGQFGLPLVTVNGNFGHLTEPEQDSSGKILDTSESVSGNFGRLKGGVNGNFGHLTPVSVEILDVVSGNFGRDINTLLNTTPGITLQQQQHAEGDAAAVAGGLLETFGIVQPFKGRILRKGIDEICIRAWMLYSVTQPDLKERPKYVGKRLMDGDEPPARFVRWAKLTADEWRALWRASCGDRSGLAPDLAGLVDEWAKDFGEMFPNGPFGDDDSLAVTRELQRAEEERTAHFLSDRKAEAPQPATLSVEEAIARGLVIPVGEDGAVWRIGELWQAALGELQLQLTGATYNTWLGRTAPVAYRDGTLVIGCHNGYAKDWLENRLMAMIKRTLADVVGRSVEVQFVVWSKEFDTEDGGSLVQPTAALALPM